MQAVSQTTNQFKGNVQFGAKVKPGEMETLRQLVKEIPNLGDNFASQLRPESVDVLRNQRYSGGIKGVFDRLMAVPAGIQTVFKLLTAQRPFVQWVQFKTDEDAVRWTQGKETNNGSYRLRNNLLIIKR